MEESVIKSEALSALLEGDDSLDVEFKEKAVTIFEAAVTEKVLAVEEKLSAQFEEKLNEETTSLYEDLTSKIDGYLSYVVETWVEENQPEVDASLRTDIAEDFMSSLKNLFTEKYIEVPESKKDLCDELQSQLEEANASIEELSSNAVTLAEGVVSLTREKIISEQSEGLSDLQASKLGALVEDVEFSSEESFAKKVSTIKESFFKPTSETVEEVLESSETEYIVDEDGLTEEKSAPTSVSKVAEFLSRNKQN
jgi:quinol monooxygenase YgiN